MIDDELSEVLGACDDGLESSLGISEGKVKMTLSRLRTELKNFLEKEGFEV